MNRREVKASIAITEIPGREMVVMGCVVEGKISGVGTMARLAVTLAGLVGEDSTGLRHDQSHAIHLKPTRMAM